MSAAVGPTETNKGTDWSNRISGEKLPYVKKRTRCLMMISCQGDFKKQVQSLPNLNDWSQNFVFVDATNLN